MHDAGTCDFGDVICFLVEFVDWRSHKAEMFQHVVCDFWRGRPYLYIFVSKCLRRNTFCCSVLFFYKFKDLHNIGDSQIKK